MSLKIKAIIVICGAVLAAGCTQVSRMPAGNPDILSIDHFVPVVSRVPSMTGSVSQVYVRERTRDSVRTSGDLEGQVHLCFGDGHQPFGFQRQAFPQGRVALFAQQ